MKKVIVLCLLAGAMVSSMFALGSTKKKKEIVLTVLDYEDSTAPNSFDTKKKVWDAFEAAHPGVKIQRETLFNEPFHQKVAAYAASGNLPDVFYMWPSGRSSMIHEKHLAMDLTPYLKKDKIYNNYNKAIIDPKQQESGYLAEIPVGLVVCTMLYANTAILKECGLSLPKTYEDIKAQVPVLKSHGYETILMANMDDWVMESCMFSMVAGRFGGPNWAGDIVSGKAKFTDKKFLDAVKFIDMLYQDGVVSRTSLSTSYGDVAGLFAAKKGAYLIDGDWRVSAFITDMSTGKALITKEDQQNNIELLNFPAIPGEMYPGTNSGIVGGGYGMSSKLKKGSDKEKAAWELVKWLSGPYCQQRRLDVGVSFPSLIKGVVFDKNKMDPLSIKRGKFYEELKSTTPVFDGSFDTSVNTVFNAALQQLGLGKTTPEQVCGVTQKAFDAWKAKQK
jgi:ABC-type sugar transport system, periplasmic component